MRKRKSVYDKNGVGSKRFAEAVNFVIKIGGQKRSRVYGELCERLDIAFGEINDIAAGRIGVCPRQLYDAACHLVSVAAANKNVAEYNPAGSYMAGEFVRHPMGIGEIREILEGEHKMLVYFPLIKDGKEIYLMLRRDYSEAPQNVRSYSQWIETLVRIG